MGKEALQIKKLNLEEFSKKEPSFCCSSYQDPRWLKIIETAFGFKSIVYTLESDSSVIGILPLVQMDNPIFGNSLISLPFLNGGGLHFNTKEETTPEGIKHKINELYSELINSLGNKYDYLELRTDSGELLSNPSFTCRQHKVTFLLDISKGSEALFKTFDKKLRAQIRRPEKSGATVRLVCGEEISTTDQMLFYKTLAHHWRDLGSPIYSKKFFDLVFQEFRSEIVLCFVEIQGKTISTGLTLISGDRAEILWAASLKSYNNISPNMLLYWRTIEKLCNLGIKEFDFGRCSKNSGTYYFKKQWSGQEKQLYWYYPKCSKQIPNVSSSNSKFKIAVSVWKYLPVCLTTIIGNKVAKFFP